MLKEISDFTERGVCDKPEEQKKMVMIRIHKNKGKRGPSILVSVPEKLPWEGEKYRENKLTT